MNSQEAREALEKAVFREPQLGTRDSIMAAADAYGDARELEVIDEILDGEYTLEQVADLRKNIEEGLQGGNA